MLTQGLWLSELCVRLEGSRATYSIPLPGQFQFVVLNLTNLYKLIRMHTRVHGGLYIYLHKMPGKHLGYSQMLGGEGFGWRPQYP